MSTFRAFSFLALLTLAIPSLNAQNFHGAPDSAKQMESPNENDPQAVAKGKPLYHLRCARCHGERGEGSGNIPPLAHGKIKAASSGEIFWFITQGDKKNGMPSWATLPKQQRWLIISYLRALGTAKATPAATPPEAEPAAK